MSLFPHPKRKDTYKGSRTVIFPDFQGIGIGGAFTSYIADMYTKKGYSYISTTSNPAMIASRKKVKIGNL